MEIIELIFAGLIVGILIGSTGMGAGSLMAPVLISLFGVSAVGAIGTDLLYSAATKAVGGWRHLALRTVNTELAWWMAAGSVPASLAGVFVLHLLAQGDTAHMQDILKVAIGFALLLVAVAVAVRTFVSIRGVRTHEGLTDGPLTVRHKLGATAIGLVFGFIFGLTSVGAGAFFGMALIMFFPLSVKRVVGTDLFHGALVTIPAAIASYFWLPDVHLATVAALMAGSLPGIIIGSHLMVGIPDKALRGSLASVLALSGLKLLGAF
jgi:uncharacterized membrane protein YfcA